MFLPLSVGKFTGDQDREEVCSDSVGRGAGFLTVGGCRGSRWCGEPVTGATGSAGQGGGSEEGGQGRQGRQQGRSEVPGEGEVSWSAAVRGVRGGVSRCRDGSS